LAVDLVLDKGMLAAGWQAHTLDSPGKFYVLADGHNQPRRARAYLVTDENVRETASRYADERPDLDPLSLGQPSTTSQAQSTRRRGPPKTRNRRS